MNNLDSSADVLATNRILYGAGGFGGGYGYGQGGGITLGNGLGTDTNSRAVLHSEIRQVKDNQHLGFDRVAEQAEITRDFAAREAIASNFANLQLGLAGQFAGIQQQFAAATLANSECCCELKAGQAEIKTAIAAQAIVKAAEDRVRTDTKLDILLAKCAS